MAQLPNNRERGLKRIKNCLLRKTNFVEKAMKNQCHAKSKRSGERCKRRASIGKNVCAMHGGKSLKGQESPRFKHGRTSKYLPERLQARFEEFEWQQQRGELLSLQEDIIVTDLRISFLVERLEGGGGQETWQELKQNVKALNKAIADGDVNQLKTSMIAVMETVNKGNQDYRSWQDLFKAQLHRKSLVESERRFLIEGKFMLGIDEALLMFSVVGDAINRNVKDAETLRNLRQDLYEIGVKTGLMLDT